MNTPDNDTSTAVHRLQHAHKKTAPEAEVSSNLRAVDLIVNL